MGQSAGFSTASRQLCILTGGGALITHSTLAKVQAVFPQVQLVALAHRHVSVHILPRGRLNPLCGIELYDNPLFLDSPSDRYALCRNCDAKLLYAAQNGADSTKATSDLSEQRDRPGVTKHLLRKLHAALPEAQFVALSTTHMAAHISRIPGATQTLCGKRLGAKSLTITAASSEHSRCFRCWPFLERN